MDSEIEAQLHHTLNDLLLMHIVIDKFVLAQHGLRRVRFYMLRHLHQNPGISMTDLSKLTFTDTASTSRMVTGLEKDGLVRRESKAGDRRFFVLWLTEAGRARYEAANADLQADIQKRFANIPPDSLNDILQKAQILSDAILRHHEEQKQVA